MIYGFIRRGFNWQSFRFGRYRTVYRRGRPDGRLWLA